MDKVYVTVNGVPVEKVIDEAVRSEYRAHRKEEVGALSRIISRVASASKIRNHSGCKSGRGRVIYSNPAFAGGAA